MPKATTVRFTDEMFARLDQASARTGMPVNSIVIAACLEWMQRHTPQAFDPSTPGYSLQLPAAPRWATLRRALGRMSAQSLGPIYPFEGFTRHAQELLRFAQSNAKKRGVSYIGTEHLLLACFDDAECGAATILRRLGIERPAVEALLDKVLADRKSQPRHAFVPTSRTKKVIQIAFELAESSDSLVGTQHILLALSREGEGIGAHVLKDLGAHAERIEKEVGSLKDPQS